MEQRKIDIAATENQGGLGGRKHGAFLERRREGGSPRPFCKVVCVCPVDADGLRDLLIAERDDARRTFEDQLDSLGIGHASCHAIGEGFGMVGRNRMPGLERKRIGRRALGLHADDLGLQTQRIARGHAAANAGALPDGHIEPFRIGMRGEQFQSVGRNTLHEIAVEGGDEFKPANLSKTPCLFACLLKIGTELDEFGSEPRIAAFFSVELPLGTRIVTGTPC